LTFDLNGETPVAAVLLAYKQEDMDAEAVACHIEQRFPNLPIIPLSAYCEMREQVLVVSALLLRFGGNLFYVVQRYRKTATPKLDCHKDFHCPVQNMNEFISHLYKVAQTQK
jgi:hypothetical protein